MGSDRLSRDEKVANVERRQHRPEESWPADGGELRPPHSRTTGYHTSTHRPVSLWRVWAGASVHYLHVTESIPCRDGGGSAVHAKPYGIKFDIHSADGR